MSECKAIRSVMVVDDDPEILRLTSKVLESRGYGVVTATNGLECLSRVRGGFNGIILMDVAMPLLGGWETIRALKEEQLLGQTLVCMLTGLPPEGAAPEFADSVVDYLNKPFTMGALIETVSDAFGLLTA